MAIKTDILSNGMKRRRGIVTKGTVSIDTRRTLVGSRDEAKLSTGDVARNIMFRRKLSSARRQRAMEEKEVYFNSTFTYQLWYGDVAMGKPREMLAREAWEKNIALEDKFYHSTSPDARLWRWRVKKQR